MTLSFDGLKGIQHRTWSSGDYANISRITVPLAHTLVETVERTGYTAALPSEGEESDQAADEASYARSLLRRLLVAAPLTAVVLVLSMAPGVPRLPWAQLVLPVPGELGRQFVVPPHRSRHRSTFPPATLADDQVSSCPQPRRVDR